MLCWFPKGDLREAIAVLPPEFPPPLGTGAALGVLEGVRLSEDRHGSDTAVIDLAARYVGKPLADARLLDIGLLSAKGGLRLGPCLVLRLAQEGDTLGVRCEVPLHRWQMAHALGDA